MPAPELDHQIKSRLTRHSVVADDEVEVVQPKRFECFIHVRGRLDRVTFTRQNLLDRIPAGYIVVCDQYGAHVRFLSEALQLYRQNWSRRFAQQLVDCCTEHVLMNRAVFMRSEDREISTNLKRHVRDYGIR